MAIRRSRARRAALFTGALLLLPHAALGVGALALIVCESIAAASQARTAGRSS